jgi:hypothetical protein
LEFYFCSFIIYNETGGSEAERVLIRKQKVKKIGKNSREEF